MVQKNYPQYYEQLQGLIGNLGHEIPGTMSGFSQLHENAVADGVLSGKIKELIALGIAISVRCDGCITYHVHDALKAGATRAEITETVGVSIWAAGVALQCGLGIVAGWRKLVGNPRAGAA